MRTDSSELALIGDLTDGEFDLFRSAIRLFLSRTFIIRGFESDERLYDFVIRNIRMFESWFSCADIELKRDEGLGVICCRGGHELRARLSREETCALLVFRLLYEEKRTEISLARYPSILVLDFVQKYRALTDRDIAKTRLIELLRRLASFRLVGIPPDPADLEGVLVLYPSLALALDWAGIDEILAGLGKDSDGTDTVDPDEADVEEES